MQILWKKVDFFLKLSLSTTVKYSIIVLSSVKTKISPWKENACLDMKIDISCLDQTFLVHLFYLLYIWLLVVVSYSKLEFSSHHAFKKVCFWQRKVMCPTTSRQVDSNVSTELGIVYVLDKTVTELNQ